MRAEGAAALCFLLLGPGAVIGEVEALFDECVDIDRPVLAGALTRVQEHVLDDRVGTFAVLYDLVEVTLQHVRNLTDLGAQLAVEMRTGKRLPSRVSEIVVTFLAYTLQGFFLPPPPPPTLVPGSLI